MSLTMKDVMTANCAISNAEMLTSNHCAALARELNKLLATDPVPPAGGEVEVLAVVTLGSFSAEELGDIDIEPRMVALESLQQEMVKNEDVYIELVDRAHVTRLQAENAALQQRLNVADQRVDELQSKLAKARELIDEAATAVG